MRLSIIFQQHPHPYKNGCTKNPVRALQFSSIPIFTPFAGDHREAAIPVPIPNTEVKRLFAKGSAGPARARVGRRRLFSFHSKSRRLRRTPLATASRLALRARGIRLFSFHSKSRRLRRSALAFARRVRFPTGREPPQGAVTPSSDRFAARAARSGDTAFFFLPKPSASRCLCRHCAVRQGPPPLSLLRNFAFRHAGRCAGSRAPGAMDCIRLRVQSVFPSKRMTRNAVKRLLQGLLYR